MSLVPSPQAIRIEAEDMNLRGFRTEDQNFASDDGLIRLSRRKGRAFIDFSGPSGLYDVVIRYHDETDGQALVKVKIGGDLLDRWRFNDDLDSRVATHDNAITRSIGENISIQQGDRIELFAKQNGHEFARIDYIEFIPRNIPEPNPVPPPHNDPLCLEAEDFDLQGFTTEHKDFASGGALIKLNQWDGKATTTFEGPSGKYKVVINYFDEDDGQARVKFKVDGTIIDDWTFDQDLDSNVATANNRVSRTITEVDINQGDEIELGAWKNGHEFARIDSIKFIPHPDPIPPVVEDGTYHLCNHPDGNAATPNYGLRLDSLLTGDTNDIFTFNFEHPDANMRMTVDGNSVRIFGIAFGGLDIGSTYDPNESGLWAIDFTYNGVSGLSGDDDLTIDAGLAGSNTGTIKQLYGNEREFDLEDYAGSFPNTFQLGNTEDDNGHRGFDGISGWGWLNHSGAHTHLSASDWLFTVKDGKYQASLGDRVWFDVNGNGIQDGGESGAEGVTVTLLEGGVDGVLGTGDDTTQTTTTNALGNYRFNQLIPSVEYQVVFSNLPEGYVFTDANQGANDSQDSDANEITGASQIITLANGEFNDTVDAGLVLEVCENFDLDFETNGLGNMLNVGQIIDDEFASLGISVFAVRSQAPLGPNRAMIFDTANPTGGDTDLATNNQGKVLIISEDGNGSNPDDNAGGGTFVFTFDSPRALEAIGLLDTEEPGGEIRAYDAGNNLISILGIPAIADGGQQLVDFGALGVSRLEVELAGSGAISHLCFGEAGLGDFVFFDTNTNGIQDGGEVGVEGVTVTLVGGGADGLISTAGDNTTETTTTNNVGFYQFIGLNSGEEYQVTFSDLPTGFIFTDPNLGGDDALDSDADLVTGSTPIVTLNPGEFNPSIDAGIIEPDTSPIPAAVGDFVFHDVNANGIQDSGEEGIDGVTVKLIADTDNDGNLDDVIATTITGDNPATTEVESGFYEFVGLDPGNYKIMFTQPIGFDSVSPFQAGGDNTVDADAGTDLMSGVISLTSGEFNSTIDAGFYNTASLGDFVWSDTNSNGIQDSGETGISGITATLTGGGLDGIIGTGGDDTTETTMTDLNGFYQFLGLNPGEEYKVTFSNLPIGATFTTPNIGLDTLDSDANPITGMTQIVTLASGEQNLTLDAGIVLNTPPEASKDVFPCINVEDGPIMLDVLANDIDPDGDVLSIISINNLDPTQGSAVIDNGKIVFTAAIGFTGNVTFDYTVDDGKGGVTSAQVMLHVIENKFDFFDGTANPDIFNGNGGNDLIKGNGGNDTLGGDTGSDRIEGGAGDDLITGTNDFALGYLCGLEEDVLLGGTGSDTFVLGNTEASYYTVDQANDCAIIEDFDLSQGDKARLHGNSALYNFTYDAGSGSSSLFAQTGTGPDLIAVFKNIQLTDADLSASGFEYAN